LTESPDFSDEEIEAVREHANRSFLSGREKRIAKLIQLQLWDDSRLNFNDRGMKIKAMLIGFPHPSKAEIDVMFRWIWGENTREGRIALEQELLDLGLAWVDEQGRLHLNARGDMVRTDAYWLRH
jgi:hypothetical protein